MLQKNWYGDLSHLNKRIYRFRIVRWGLGGEAAPVAPVTPVCHPNGFAAGYRFLF